MNIKIISIGKKLNTWEKEGVHYYVKQFPKNIKLDFLNIGGLQNLNLSKEIIKKKECDLIASKIKSKDLVISWDSTGDKLNSTEFSAFLKNTLVNNTNINFVIGGSYGLSLDFLKKSDKVFSASKFTFPHRLFKIILVEQIYRGISIIDKTPYHK